MKRYIKSGNTINTSINSEEDVLAIQGIAKQILSSIGFDTSSWSFVRVFDGGFGKKGLIWNTPYGEAHTILGLTEYNKRGIVNCEFRLHASETFNHPFFTKDMDTTWTSVAEEFLR
jgi:hypothetical protein